MVNIGGEIVVGVLAHFCGHSVRKFDIFYFAPFVEFLWGPFFYCSGSVNFYPFYLTLWFLYNLVGFRLYVCCKMRRRPVVDTHHLFICIWIISNIFYRLSPFCCPSLSLCTSVFFSLSLLFLSLFSLSNSLSFVQANRGTVASIKLVLMVLYWMQIQEDCCCCGILMMNQMVEISFVLYNCFLCRRQTLVTFSSYGNDVGLLWGERKKIRIKDGNE